MKIKFLGAAGTVTGSSYALTSGSGQSILIDLGMFQGLPEIDNLNYKPFEYDCKKLSGVVLTHAHLDHCGRLPIIIPKGFRGDIWMTPSTADLTEISLLDSAKIVREDRSRVLYDKDLAIKTIKSFKTMEYRTPFQIGPFTITFRDAGHILGSACLEIEDAYADSEIKKIIFSGDLGNSPEELLMETELLDSADAVVMESTYGDSLHTNHSPFDILQAEINAVENNGGTLLMPAFALERTQELLHIIMHLKKDGKVRADTPVFLDSPMAEKATNVYTNYYDLMNDHAKQDIDNGTIFGFPGLEVLLRKEQGKAIYRLSGPKVIIAGAGMMTGGRILSHAAHYLPKESTRLLIVGYQGEGTLGRDLLEGKKEIRIDKTDIFVKASINSTNALSSHADQRQLMEWLTHIKGVKKVIITHGEDKPRAALAKKITEDLGITDVRLPLMNQEFSI